MVKSSIGHPILEHLHGQLRLWQFSINLRDVSSFLNVYCLQRKLLGWKGRIFQNMTVIRICSWWKASSLMGGYPAWFLCVAHPLPVPVSNRKGLKQRREEHWLPGNCNTEWRNSRRELCYKQASLSDLSCSDLQVTTQNRVLHLQMLLGRLEGSLAGFFWWRSYASWDELGMKKAKKLSLRDVKDRDSIILNICFASVNSEFPPLQYPPKSLQEAGPLFSQILVSFWAPLDTLFTCRWKSGQESCISFMWPPLLSQTGLLSSFHNIL